LSYTQLDKTNGVKTRCKRKIVFL